jgi:MYXO-CTERM domain-containing protein
VVPSRESRLLVLARTVSDRAAAGGTPWLEIDRVENQIAVQWTLRSVRLPAELTRGQIKLRFVAEDANAGNGGVEAAIDDLEVSSNLATCHQPPPRPPGKSGGCSLTPAAPAGAGGAGLLLLAFVLLAPRIRRH